MVMRQGPTGISSFLAHKKQTASATLSSEVVISCSETGSDLRQSNDLANMWMREVSMRKRLAFQAIAVLLLLSGTLYAQDRQGVEKTRADILANKKKIMATTLELGGHEADVFWPLYDEYQNALRPVHDRSSRLIADYLRDYETLTDEQARGLLREFLAIEREQLKLKEVYVKKFSAVLSPKKVARYFQLENKIQSVIDYDLAKKIPVVR